MMTTTRKQAEGKDHPPGGRVDPSLTAIGLTGTKPAEVSLVNKEEENMKMVFEQLPREGTKAFAAFRTYLELGPERSLAKVAVLHSKGKRILARWSQQHQWLARVDAYAAHLARRERGAIEALALEKAVEWHRIHERIRMEEWQRHKKLVALADAMLSRWEKDEAKCGTLEGIARIIELATKLARLAAGMPTEVKEVNTTLAATVDVDWEVAIRKAYGQAEGVRSDSATVKRSDSGGEGSAVIDVAEVKAPGARAELGATSCEQEGKTQ
jgi:hypothetical protein